MIITWARGVGDRQASSLTVVQTLSVLEQPRCAMEYVLRPPLAASDHEIVLVSPGRGESSSFDEIRKGEQ